MKLNDCGLDVVRDEIVHEVGSVSDMLMREEHEECENVDHENDYMLNATLLKNGRTAHSTFSLPLKRLSKNAVANVDAALLQSRMLRKEDVIIWDEISTQSRFAVECVDRLLRDVAAPENRGHHLEAL
ncbi:unnamed protein product [Cylicostephanus goldi]|uniref:ATP-dependent DNA helicase n=1 Tax=Cylicostephanus goldi TaxID=71465 RepID=A0A3P7QW03_CYLGO|nr:unnamed protein product [Cylicostephanus goldi]